MGEVYHQKRLWIIPISSKEYKRDLVASEPINEFPCYMLQNKPSVPMSNLDFLKYILLIHSTGTVGTIVSSGSTAFTLLTFFIPFDSSGNKKLARIYIYFK